MAAVKMRHFVLVEPFRKADVSIFEDTPLGLRNAETLYRRFQQEGKRVKFVTQTGTVTDLKGTLAVLKSELLK